MDDGWEMSDGVQAKVPIRGQPEGGVSPTGANGRRLGETATVAYRSAPPSQTQPRGMLCYSTALHFIATHLWVTLVCLSIASSVCVSVCVHVCFV